MGLVHSPPSPSALLEAMPVTPRQLEALVRLSEARAKAELRRQVTVEDVEATRRRGPGDLGGGVGGGGGRETAFFFGVGTLLTRFCGGLVALWGAALREKYRTGKDV